MRYRIGWEGLVRDPGAGHGNAVSLQVLQERAIDHHISSDEIR